jgi:bifunctional non-homologous end joining protein LigD
MKTSLYYREGSSDKVYQVELAPMGGLFLVNFAFGRRGSTLNTGTKTPAPVDEAKAKEIFAKLVREKKAKGYTEGADGTPYLHPNISTRTNPHPNRGAESVLNCSTPSTKPKPPS